MTERLRREVHRLTGYRLSPERVAAWGSLEPPPLPAMPEDLEGALCRLYVALDARDETMKLLRRTGASPDAQRRTQAAETADVLAAAERVKTILNHPETCHHA